MKLCPAQENNYSTFSEASLLNNGNHTVLGQATDKQRPSSTAKVAGNEPILVTPIPVITPMLSTKATLAVISRQLTMQLMPMYRIR